MQDYGEDGMAYDIFAHHAHVFPKNVREDGTVDNLLRLMDENGIARGVCFSAFPAHLKPENGESNAWLHKEIQGNDRLCGFGVIDFEKGDLRGQVDRITDFGFKGIKIHPAFQHVCADGEKMLEVCARAEENGLFVTFHTGVHWARVSDYLPWRFDELAYHFPKLRFSMEHIGGYCYFNDTLAVLLNNALPGRPPRVYGGLTTVFFREGRHRLWYLSDQQIKDLLWQLGAEYLIFGLDFPYNTGAEIKFALDYIRNMELSDEGKQLILGGNLLRALNMA